MAHSCHARGCDVPVHPRFLMCRSHWAMVPAPMQSAVYRHYRPGQEVDKNPTQDYLRVAASAISYVWNLELLRKKNPKPPDTRPRCSYQSLCGEPMHKRNSKKCPNCDKRFCMAHFDSHLRSHRKRPKKIRYRPA